MTRVKRVGGVEGSTSRASDLPRVLAWFGLTPASARERCRRHRDPAPAAEVDARLGPGQIALILGPSGTGKSGVLAHLTRRLVRSGRPAITPPTAEALDAGGRVGGRALDLLGVPPEDGLRWLARAGLADATRLALPVRRWSDGERFRLRLALGMARASCASGPATLIVDEFASTLDRTTARNVAGTLARWVRARPSGGEARGRAVLATAHDDLLEALRPDLLVLFDAEGRGRVEQRPPDASGGGS